jgi:hypothetical protein
MLELFRKVFRPDDHRLRSFAANCLLREYRVVPAGREAERAVVELFLRYLTGLASHMEWLEGYSGAGGFRLYQDVQSLLRPDPVTTAEMTAGRTAGNIAAYRTWNVVAIDFESIPEDQLVRQEPHRRAAEKQEDATLATLLREIVGNPFRPVTFDPDWSTSSAHGLALSMYESRDFSPMPILADSLEEAGCDNPDILTHCREPGNHVRGCWVVDLVLGKS